jgi:hypothetical protein
LRLWESEGTDTEAEIHVAGAARLQPVDLRDRPTGDPIPGEAGTFRARFRPFQIRTFVVEHEGMA